MTDDAEPTPAAQKDTGSPRSGHRSTAGSDDLPAAARRALAEAEARRNAIDATVAAMPEERGGRDGPEPVRYGDWERKGIASDF